jgi:hypothetical protein
MEELFPRMLDALLAASASLSTALVPADKAEPAEFLMTRLMQLNMALTKEYVFDKGMPGDIVAYAQLLKDNEKECADLVTYLLNRHLMFGDNNSYDKYEALFLEEVMNGVIEHSNSISRV